jgi:hypothetical protein
VSDLYRWWYRQRNLTPNRLLVESVFIMEPYWILRTGSVPFWMKFNMEASLDYVHQYLDSTDPYDEIYLTLFQHGVDAVGLPSIDEWRTVFERARTRAALARHSVLWSSSQRRDARPRSIRIGSMRFLSPGARCSTPLFREVPAPAVQHALCHVNVRVACRSRAVSATTQRSSSGRIAGPLRDASPVYERPG